MISVREGETELTDILLSGATIDPDIRERVRLLSTLDAYTIIVQAGFLHYVLTSCHAHKSGMTS